jgi:glucan phosphoethanolaminetransferase (alkaline phosphatase superfamily)
MMKNKNKELSLFRTALWGYSTLMLLFISFFTLIPTGNNSGQTADPVAGLSSLSPIAIFLILVIIEHKQYKWNIWKVFLCVYSCILIALFALAVFYVSNASSDLGVSAGTSSSFIGFLYLPVLFYFVILGYERFV